MASPSISSCRLTIRPCSRRWIQPPRSRAPRRTRCCWRWTIAGTGWIGRRSKMPRRPWRSAAERLEAPFWMASRPMARASRSSPPSPARPRPCSAPSTPAWRELAGGSIAEMNARILAIARRAGPCCWMSRPWPRQVGTQRWFDPVRHLAYKLPFASDLAGLYADWLGRLLGAARGKARKCLVLDLDNTLWGGVVGDDGIESLVLGQGSAARRGLPRHPALRSGPQEARRHPGGLLQERRGGRAAAFAEPSGNGC